MHLLSVTVASIFMALLVKKIIYDIFLAERCEKRKWDFIEKEGYYKFLRKSISYTAYIIFFFLFAYKFAEFSLIWLILAILLAMIVLITTLVVSRKEFRDSPKMAHKPENYIRAVQGRRYFSIISILVLIMWLISWKHLID